LNNNQISRLSVLYSCDVRITLQKHYVKKQVADMGIMKRGFRFPPMGSLKASALLTHTSGCFFISDGLQFIGFKREIVLRRIALSNELVLT